MKITSLVAATAAVLVTLGACSAPVGLDSTTAAPSLELSNTLSATTTFLVGVDTTTVAPTATCPATTTATITTPTTTSTSQLSATGTYAVAYGGSTVVAACPTTP